jgi:hypothetical protein
MFRSSIALIATLSLAAACSNKDGESGGGAPGPVELTALGLVGEAPSGSTVSKAPIGEGVMVQGPGLVVTVEVASDSRPATADAAKTEADMYSPKNAKTEALADGWAFTFENQGAMGTNHFVNVRREIGGKAIWCETTAPEKAQADNALALCKSLKPQG